MNCSYCNKPVVLVPSAQERAAKFGGRPSDYTALFPDHAECFIKARDKPSPHIPVSSLPVIFQEAEMLRLRQMACKLFGVEAGTRQTADVVNAMGEDQLVKFLGLEVAT